LCITITMFIFLTSLVLTFAASDARSLSFTQDGNGTGICPPNPDGFLHPVPCPWDCTKYYICEENNIAIEMDCAPPLVFDPDLELCNWPYMVNCEATTTEKPETTTGEPVTGTTNDAPTDVSTDAPTDGPTYSTSGAPTDGPTYTPTSVQSTTEKPETTTGEPATYSTSGAPTYNPTYPTHAPTYPTYNPTYVPTTEPTYPTSIAPTDAPTDAPTNAPTTTLLYSTLL